MAGGQAGPKGLPDGRRRAGLAFLGFLLLGTTLHAQTDPRLVAAVHLAQDGRGDSARAIVGALFKRTQPSDTLFPQILYTQGLIATSAMDMQRNFQRVAVEYAFSSWADDALLRLAQLDFASGNPAGTVRDIERIRSDYPDSPLLPQASYWAARGYFELKNDPAGCAWLSKGMAAAADNIELQNQLAFYSGRCATAPVESAGTAGEAPTGDTGRATPAPPVPPAVPPASAPPARTGWSVQVAAVKDSAAADRIVAQYRAGGYDSRQVRDPDGLIRVRVGNYPDRTAAMAAATKIKAKFGGQPFVLEDQ